jgi:hypothetical protein
VSVTIYVFFLLFSHRGITGILAQEIAFNPFAAMVRLHTWNYGFEAALGSPIFGIGYADWARPFWLTSSVDNFWLLNAMRYGLPAAALMIAGIIILLWRVATVETQDERFAAYRLGFVVALVGMSLSLGTVHAWNALYSYFFFLLGAGVWMIQPDQAAEMRDDARGRGTANRRRSPEQRREVGVETSRRPPTGSDSATPAPKLGVEPVRPTRPGRR